MKKKIVLAVSAALIAAVAMVALVSCVSNPYDFIEKFAKAESFTVSISDESLGEIAAVYDNGSTSYELKTKNGDLVSAQYMILKGDKVDFYNYVALTKTWSKTEIAADSTQYKDAIKEAREQFKSIVGEVDKDSLVKEDGYWFAKGADGNAIKDLGLKISGNSLEAYMKTTNKDGKETYKKMVTLTLSGSVKAPDTDK